MDGKTPLHNDTPIPFRCISCGECCRGDMKVRLNPRDVYRLARHLKMVSTEELFSSGLLFFPEKTEQPHRPVLRFKTRPFPFCPFLENRLDDDGTLTGRCLLHGKAKPLICRTAPVGRAWDPRTEQEDYYYLPPLPGCPGDGLKGETLEIYLRNLKEDYRWETEFFIISKKILESANPGNAMEELYKMTTGRPFADSWREAVGRLDTIN